MTSEAVMFPKIDHVSLAVRDFKKASEFFTSIFEAIPGMGSVNRKNKYRWQMFFIGDFTRLEIISPTDEECFLNKFLSGGEGGVHHITIQTEDIKKAKDHLETKGIPYFGYNEYPTGDWKEFFIHPKDAFGVLIQVAEINIDDFHLKSRKLNGKNRWRIEKTSSGLTIEFDQQDGGAATVDLTVAEAKELIKDIEKNI